VLAERQQNAQHTARTCSALPDVSVSYTVQGLVNKVQILSVFAVWPDKTSDTYPKLFNKPKVMVLAP
jgi:hypothetical protein